MPHTIIARQSGLVKKCFNARSASPPTISFGFQLAVRRWVCWVIAYLHCFFSNYYSLITGRSLSCQRTTNNNYHIPKKDFDIVKESKELMNLFQESKELGFVVETQSPPAAWRQARPSVYDTQVHSLEELKRSILKLQAAV
eukprot:747898-Hanusia_phi.AAC.3